jgi:hypothetical protein
MSYRQPAAVPLDVEQLVVVELGPWLLWLLRR